MRGHTPRLAAGLWLALTGCPSSEAVCTDEEFERLLQICLDAGGDFEGETRGENLTDCALDVTTGVITAGTSGRCKIEGKGECAITCDLPEPAGT